MDFAASRLVLQQCCGESLEVVDTGSLIVEIRSLCQGQVRIEEAISSLREALIGLALEKIEDIRSTQRDLAASLSSLSEGHHSLVKSMKRLQADEPSWSVSARMRHAADDEDTGPDLSRALGSSQQKSFRLGEGPSDGPMTITPGSRSKRLPLYLSVMWPADVELREPLQTVQEAGRNGLDERSSRTFAAENARQLARGASNQKRGHLAVHPLSWQRLAFDVFAVAILICDLTWTPYALAFRVPHTRFLIWCDVGVACFWLIDIVASFMTSYYEDGELHEDFSSIAKHYLRGWFPLDTSIVLCDLATTIVGEVIQEGSVSGSLNVLRIAKISRFVRVINVIRLLKRVDDYITGGFRTMVQILGIFLVVFWVSHLACCCWYAVGTFAPSDTGLTWLDTTITVGGITSYYRDTSPWFQYFTSLHWSMAQMTLGAIEVVSSSVLERIVSITMMLLGMLCSATLVSALSASMIGLQMRMGEQQQKLLILDTFLRQNNVGPSVALRVRQQVEKGLAKVERLAESDVSVVSLLSPSLRQELRFNMFGHCIIKHPLFRLWSNLSTSFVREVCTIAVSSQSLPAKHELFVAGTASNEAYVVMSGRLAYCQDLEEVCDDGIWDSSMTEVNAQEWLCEAALWMSWLHVGSAVADEDSQILRVDASSLLSLLPNHRLIQELTGHYATAFHRRVISARPPAPWPNDYQIPVDTFGQLVSSMPTNVPGAGFGQLISTMPSNIRTTVSMVSVYRAPQRWASAVDRLKDEVLDGYSVLVLDGDGNPACTVRRMLLELERGDGRILVQMGRRDGKNVKVNYELPQVSAQIDPSFDHGWRVLLERKMAPFADALVPVSSYTRTRRELAEATGIPLEVQETFVRAEWNSNMDMLAARDILRYTRRTPSLQNSAPPSPRRRSFSDSSSPSSRKQGSWSERPFVKLENFFQWETVDGAGFFSWVTLDEFDSFLTNEGRKFLEKEMAGLDEAEASPSSAAFFLS